MRSPSEQPNESYRSLLRGARRSPGETEQLLQNVLAQTSRMVGRRRLRRFASSALAMAVCGAGLMGFFSVGVGAPVARGSMVAMDVFDITLIQAECVARITREIDVPRPAHSLLPLCGETIENGQWLRVDSGVLEITYNNGGKVVLHGPAVYEVVRNGGWLVAGSLVATACDGSSVWAGVPEGQGAAAPRVLSLCKAPRSALAIRTSSCIVADLDREAVFGVREDAGGSHIEVSGGKAAICSNIDTFEQRVEDALPLPYQVLSGGEAARAEVRAAPFGPVVCCVKTDPGTLFRD